MYKLPIIFQEQTKPTCVIRSDGAAIPFDPDNTDYQQFKKDIQNGVVLNDAEGNPITGTALTTFLNTLP